MLPLSTGHDWSDHIYTWIFMAYDRDGHFDRFGMATTSASNDLKKKDTLIPAVGKS